MTRVYCLIMDSGAAWHMYRDGAEPTRCPYDGCRLGHDMEDDLEAEVEGLEVERVGDDMVIAELRAALNPWTHAHWSHQSFVDGCYPCVLIQQNDELRAENERLHVQVMETARECGIQKTENERLRAALTEITELDLEGDASLDDAIGFADEALHPPPPAV